MDHVENREYGGRRKTVEKKVGEVGKEREDGLVQD